MSLLNEIQSSLLGHQEEIAPILLKLRFLASRLGSVALEDWIKHESEGYPPTAILPDYRKVGISYTADFSGPFGSGVKNAPIPPHLIEIYAGSGWTSYELRQSVSAIDRLVSGSAGGTLHINAANLILLL